LHLPCYFSGRRPDSDIRRSRPLLRHDRFRIQLAARRRTPQVKFFLKFVLSILLIVFAFWLITTLLVTSRRSEREREKAELAKQFPATRANASALELERIAARLGLDLSPYASGRIHPDKQLVDANLKVRSAVSNYVDAQLSKA